MRPKESFVGQPIRSLQTMLRVISEADSRYPSVIPDGVYTQDTTRAVSYFQKQHGLPVTGVADQQTWETIVSVYEPAEVEILEAEPLIIFLEPGEIISLGEENPNLYLVQAVLTVLSKSYTSITAPSQSGILDVATADSLSSFQQLTDLPVTGQLDKATWKALALHYPGASAQLME